MVKSHMVKLLFVNVRSVDYIAKSLRFAVDGASPQKQPRGTQLDSGRTEEEPYDVWRTQILTEAYKAIGKIYKPK